MRGYLNDPRGVASKTVQTQVLKTRTYLDADIDPPDQAALLPVIKHNELARLDGKEGASKDAFCREVWPDALPLLQVEKSAFFVIGPDIYRTFDCATKRL
jgi:hypothetical protein